MHINTIILSKYLVLYLSLERLHGRPGTGGVYVSYDSDTSMYVLAVKLYQNRSSHCPASRKICYNKFLFSTTIFLFPTTNKKFAVGFFFLE